MNASSAMNASQLADLSLRTLSQQSLNHISFIVFGSFDILINLLVAATIISAKILRNKSQFIILSHTVSVILYVSVFFLVSVYKVAYLNLRIPDISTSVQCVLKQLPMNFVANLLRAETLGLGLDRFMCLVFPIFYKTKTMRYVIWFNVVAWGFALVKIPFGFLGIDTSDKLFPKCSPANFNPTYQAYNNIEGNVLMALIVATYSACAGVMLWRYKQGRMTSGADKGEWRRQVDFNVFVAMSLVGVAYVVSYGALAVINSAAALTLSEEVAMKLGPVTSLLLLASSMSHLFIYLKFNKSFREAFLRMIKLKRTNAVGSFMGSRT